MVIREKFSEKRNIAEAGFRPAIDRKTFRPLEGTIDKRQVDLESEPRIEIVPRHELRDRAVQVLAGRIVDFLPVELKRAEVSELLRDRKIDVLVECRNVSGIRAGFELRRIAPAQIAAAGS